MGNIKNKPLSPITAIVFSRDRAMQLDATLRSYFLHCQDTNLANIHVIFRTTDALHEGQYYRLIHEYKNHTNLFFHHQRKFHQDVLGLIAEGAGMRWRIIMYQKLLLLGHRSRHMRSLCLRFYEPHYILFLVDDNLFVQDFYLQNIIDALEAHPDALGFSLRLGANTTYCYMSGRSQALPDFTIFKLLNSIKVLEFYWTKCKDDFGYPLEVSSSIYRTYDLLPLLNQHWFGSPNQLEGCLAKNTDKFLPLPKLLCFEQSVTFCIPVNIVQQEFSSKGGITHAYSNQSLAEKFAEGERLDVEAYHGFIPTGCHQEIALKFRKPTDA